MSLIVTIGVRRTELYAQEAFFFATAWQYLRVDLHELSGIWWEMRKEDPTCFGFLCEGIEFGGDLCEMFRNHGRHNVCLCIGISRLVAIGRRAEFATSLSLRTEYVIAW